MSVGQAIAAKPGERSTLTYANELWLLPAPVRTILFAAGISEANLMASTGTCSDPKARNHESRRDLCDAAGGPISTPRRLLSATSGKKLSPPLGPKSEQLVVRQRAHGLHTSVTTGNIAIITRCEF